MKKTRQIIVFIAAIVVLLFLSARFTGISLTQAGVLTDSEKADHYGPSDKVLLEYSTDDGRGIVIGKCGDRGLSAVRTKKTGKLFFTKDIIEEDNEHGFRECDYCVNVFTDPELDLIYGMIDTEEIRPVTITIYSGVNEITGELELATDENGFFYKTDVSQELAPDGDSEWNWNDFMFAEYTTDDINGYRAFNSRMVRGLNITNVSGKASADTAYPVDWSFLLDAGEGELSASVINKLNQIMEPIVRDGSLDNFNPNMMYCFLGHESNEMSVNLTLSNILKYFPRDREAEVTEEIRYAIENSKEWKETFPPREDGEAWTFDNIPTPVHVYDGETVREAVKYYTDMNADQLRASKVNYLKDPDVYWTYTSDFGPPYFKAMSGYKNDIYVCLYNYEEYRHGSMLVLREKEGRYIIDQIVHFGSDDEE